MSKRSFMVLGHRGLAGSGAENSVASVEAALAAGCHGVEVDVRQTLDGHLVLSHDPIHAGLQIDTATLSDLEKAGPLDTLERLLASGHGVLDLEIKSPMADQRSLIDSLNTCLDATDPAGLLVSSFFLPVLEAMSTHAYPLGVLTADWYDPDGSAALDAAISLGASTILPSDASVNGPRLVERASSAGIDVIAWTVNDPKRASELLSWGAAGVITDVPVEILAAVS